MRIAVIGAGAVGSAIAAGLVRAGRDVALVARGRRLAALQAGPLRIEAEGAVRAVAVRAVAAPVSPVDLAICCVKTPDFDAALAAIAPAMAPDGMVLTLQNGVEAHESAARVLPGASILAGRLHGFFEMHGGLVRHVGVAPSILLGRTHGDPLAEARAVAAFAQSGIAAEASPAIVLALWRKFLLAASLGTVAAALDMPAGQVASDGTGMALLHEAMGEVVALAQRVGVPLDQRDIAQTLRFIATFPPDATTSLQRDLGAGRPSEHDALAGAMLRIGRTQRFYPAVFARLAARLDTGH